MSGRIRTLKPEILEDERTARLSHAAWRLFVSLILVADDYGNFRANPDQLRATVFWGATPDEDPIVAGGVDALLARLARPEDDGSPGLITLYRVRGQRYGHLEGWSKNQRISHKGAPRVPGPDSAELIEKLVDSGGAPEPLRSPSGDTPEVLRPDLRSPITDHDQRSTTTARAERVPTNERKSSARGSRIPPDYKPTSATVEAFRKDGYDALAHVDEFADYWKGVSGAKGIKLDWEATFRNRMRQLIADGRATAWEAPPEPPKPIVRVPPPPEAIAALRELEEKSAREVHVEVGERAEAWRSNGGAP